MRGGYLLECRQELGSWRWELACEQAAAPLPRPAKPPASALSPELAGEKGNRGDLSLSPKRISRAGGEGKGEGRLFARMPPRTWLLEVGVGLRASGRPSPSAGKNAGLCPPPEGAGEKEPCAIFPSPPSAFGARGERDRVRGGYLLECRQELGSWRWALACEPAVAPHPRPARTPASALSPKGRGRGEPCSPAAIPLDPERSYFPISIAHSSVHSPPRPISSRCIVRSTRPRPTCSPRANSPP